MRLIIVRHGETEENVKGICQGQTPGQLTEKGIDQAKKLALRLKEEKFDKIYCSDLKRAVDTCAEIMKFHSDTEVEQVKDLRERTKGIFEGKTHAELDEFCRKKGHTRYTYFPEGAETVDAKDKRIMEFYQQMIDKHLGKTILWVTHGEPIYTLLTKILERDVALIELQNTSVTIIDVDDEGKHKAHLVNCARHL